MKRGWVGVAFGFLAMCFLLCSNIEAATRTAATCSRSHVQKAINAAHDGDTVVIPDGSCTWSSSVSLSGAKTVQGQHTCSVDSDGRATSCATIISGSGLVVTGTDGKAWRIHDLGFSGVSGIAVHGTSKTWRIDHNYFNAVGGWGATDTRIIFIDPGISLPGTPGYTTGVIDHNTFYHPHISICVHVRESGNYDWDRNNSFGNSDAIYIEDNTLVGKYNADYSTGDPLTDCETGGSFVARYNKIINGWLETHAAVITNMRGCRKWEVYNNTFTNPAVDWNWGVHLRGGSGMVFNNTWDVSFDNAIALNVDRTYITGGDPWQHLCPNSDGDKAILGDTSNYPQSCSSGTGCVKIDGFGNGNYPCRDQIGWAGAGTQYLQPALFWNNKVGGSYVDPVLWDSCSGCLSTYLQSGRDYCTDASNRGVMPSSCNGITTTYTPYTYPHPLQVR